MIEHVIPDEGLMQPSGPAVQKIDTEDYSPTFKVDLYSCIFDDSRS